MEILAWNLGLRHHRGRAASWHSPGQGAACGLRCSCCCLLFLLGGWGVRGLASSSKVGEPAECFHPGCTRRCTQSPPGVAPAASLAGCWAQHVCGRAVQQRLPQLRFVVQVVLPAQSCAHAPPLPRAGAQQGHPRAVAVPWPCRGRRVHRLPVRHEHHADGGPPRGGGWQPRCRCYHHCYHLCICGHPAHVQLH